MTIILQLASDIQIFKPKVYDYEKKLLLRFFCDVSQNCRKQV